MCIPDSEIISQIVWPGGKSFYMPNSCIRAERVTMGKNQNKLDVVNHAY